MERSLSCSNFETNQLSNHTTTTMTTTTTTTTTTITTMQQVQQCESIENSKISRAPSRKKRLHRQKSTVYCGDDNEYAADLEEDEDEYEGFGPNEHEQLSLSPNATAVILAVQKKKQVRFQRHKQQSEASLLTKNTIASSSTATANAQEKIGSSPNSERLLRSDGSFDSTTEHNPFYGRQPLTILKRDNSILSDSSRYSSVDSLLEARKPDPEAILINLGFGPVDSEDILSRIPKRFLKPSQVRGVDTEAFVKRLQLASHLADHSVLGYRGLTGNPDIPPSHIVAKIMERFEKFVRTPTRFDYNSTSGRPNNKWKIFSLSRIS